MFYISWCITYYLYKFLCFFFILNSDLLVVLCSRYTGWCRNMPDTNPRWLRLCFDSSLSTMPTETLDDVSLGNYITPEKNVLYKKNYSYFQSGVSPNGNKAEKLLRQSFLSWTTDNKQLTKKIHSYKCKL